MQITISDTKYRNTKGYCKYLQVLYRAPAHNGSSQRTAQKDMPGIDSGKFIGMKVLADSADNAETNL